MGNNVFEEDEDNESPSLGEHRRGQEEEQLFRRRRWGRPGAAVRSPRGQRGAGQESARGRCSFQCGNQGRLKRSAEYDQCK